MASFKRVDFLSLSNVVGVAARQCIDLIFLPFFVSQVVVVVLLPLTTAVTMSFFPTLVVSMVAVTLLMRFSPAASSQDLLWLPLGDSITYGCGTDAVPRGGATCAADAGGYRVPLAWSLSQQGYNVSTMGTIHTGPAYVPAQWTAHELSLIHI